MSARIPDPMQPLEPGGARVTPAPFISAEECRRRFSESFTGQYLAMATATAKGFADLRRAREERIDNGEECERCGSRDMEQHVATGVFCCNACQQSSIDLRGMR